MVPQIYKTLFIMFLRDLKTTKFVFVECKTFYSKCLRKSEAALFVSIDIISDNSKRSGYQADYKSKRCADMILDIVSVHA